MKHNDMTVRELAEKAGVSVDAVYKWHYRAGRGSKNRFGILVFTKQEAREYLGRNG